MRYLDPSYRQAPSTAVPEPAGTSSIANTGTGDDARTQETLRVFFERVRELELKRDSKTNVQTNMNLTKSEMLMLVNLKPASEARLAAIVEDCNERFTDDERDELLRIVQEVLRT